jgi:hypothetical protein
MTFIADFSERVFFPAQQDLGRETRSIGWLGDHVTNRGTVGPATMEAIRYFRTAHRRVDPFRGIHVCEICKQAIGREEFFIDLDGIRYILPQMIIHYIEDHGYAPPSGFQERLEQFWTANGQRLTETNPSAACVLDASETNLVSADGTE